MVRPPTLLQFTISSWSCHPFVRSVHEHALSHPPNWSRLHTLSLRVDFEAEKVKKTVEFLKDFHPPNLKDVAVMLTGYIRTAIELLRGEDTSSLGCSELEHELLRFPRHALTFSVDEPGLHPRRTLFWIRELGQHFPALRDRNAFALESESTTDVGHDNAATTLAVSPDSRRIATGSWDSTIILWDSSGEIVHEWVAHPGGVRSLAFSPDSQRLVSAGMDEKVAIWDLSGGGAHKLATLAGHTHWVSSCAWSPDGSMIASACDEAGHKAVTVRLWDARTFAPRRVLAGRAHTKAIYFVCFSPDGRWLASGGDDRHCCVWAVSSEADADADADAPHAVLRGHRHRLQAAAFHPDSVRLCTAAQDRTARIWRVDTGEELLVLRGHEGWVYDVAFSPNWALVLTASEDGTVKVWDADGGAMLLSLSGHEETVCSVCFSPCGRYFASAGEDMTVRLWRVRDGVCMETFDDHEGKVSKVAFSPDGRTLCSGAFDGTVFIRSLCN
ncbi:WD40 repeat-like protein [Ganoderma leucocontextum]|nr:WD40 repeat-like protein [Ganoderma leucocontextum]